LLKICGLIVVKRSSKSDLTGLSKFEALTIAGGAELEKALSWVADKIERFVSFDHVYDFNTDRLKNWLGFYSQKKFIQKPEKFFTPRKKIPLVKEKLIHKLEDGAVLDISYKSNYKVKCEEYREEFESYKENRTVHARMWRHDSGAKATMIALHGWTMDDQRLTALAFLPGYFYRLGLDVVLIELPFHGRRLCKDSAGKRISFPAPHIARTNEGMGQAISDLRRLKNYLSSKGQERVGCIGMSLGGYIASLWASLDPLDFCIPIVPVADLGELAWDVGSNRKEFEALKEAGLTLDDLRKVYRIHSPLTHQRKMGINRTMIIAGLADHIVPPKHPKMLWEHWGQPEAHWLSGGHLVHLRENKAIRKIADFLIRLGFGNRVQEAAV
jgi:pimeloyl-ACP methyl ester carboxylesterase